MVNQNQNLITNNNQIESFDIDIAEKLERILSDEVSYSINSEIVSRIIGISEEEARREKERKEVIRKLRNSKIDDILGSI